MLAGKEALLLTLSFLSFFSCRLSRRSSLVLPFESSLSELLLFFFLCLRSLESSLPELDPESDLERERERRRLELASLSLSLSSLSLSLWLSFARGDLERERERDLSLLLGAASEDSPYRSRPLFRSSLVFRDDR
jgi:hypothetical protein